MLWRLEIVQASGTLYNGCMTKKMPATDDANYIAIGISIGTAIGVALGLTVFDNIALGIGVGMALGIAIGAGMSSSNKGKQRDR